MHIEPVTALIGAEVSGANLENLTNTEFAQIERAFTEHQVLFFRDQPPLEPEAQIAFATRFGEPHYHPAAPRPEGYPELFVIHAHKDSTYADGNGWHTDVTWSATPPKYALLRAEVIPEFGGDTLWGSMTAAYEALSPAMQKLFDGLEVRHDNTSFIEGLYTKMGVEQVKKSGIDQRLRDAHPGVNHPLVRTHPETGRRAILFGGGFMRHIVGVNEDENQLLMSFLRRHIDNPHLHCRWQWRPGDLAIWDERSTVHRALSDHFPQRRVMHRCVVNGDRPYFDAAVVAA